MKQKIVYSEKYAFENTHFFCFFVLIWAGRE